MKTRQPEKSMMTKAEAEEFTARWRLVNDATNEELRRSTVEERFRQLAILFEASHKLGWAERMGEGEEEVRDRWRRLKEACHV